MINKYDMLKVYRVSEQAKNKNKYYVMYHVHPKDSIRLDKIHSCSQKVDLQKSN